MNRAFFFMVVLLTGASLRAQMSPFDESYCVLVKIRADNLPADVRLELQEVQVPTDSCSFGSKPLHMMFQVPEKVLIKKSERNKRWKYRAKEYAKDAAFMAPGYYAIVLHQGERSCKTPEGRDYQHKERFFQIVAVEKNNRKMLVDVPTSNVYDLKQMEGRWNEMMAIEINYP
jgi:hypothetical protein